MTERKRRRPTPGFGIPPPFSPITGTHSTLRVEGEYPYCAMMQVAAADTHADYVICRGFDPRIRKFIDYAAGDADKPGISVAKPFGNRTVGSYTVAEVYPAFLPTQGAEDYTPPSPTAVDWRVGQNPGTAPTAHAGGHPTALVDTITELIDHNSKYVQWLLVDRGSGSSDKVLWGKATANWTDNGASCDHVTVNPCDDCEGANPTAAVVTVLLPKTAEQDPNVIAGNVIGYELAADSTYCCASDYLDDKIGTVKMWATGTASIPPGWAIMNGFNNAAGSGIDMTDRFVKGGTVAGKKSGTATHNHEIHVSIESTTAIQIAQLLQSIPGLFEIVIPDHSVSDLEHEHPISEETPSLNLGWEKASITWDGAAHNTWTVDRDRLVGCTQEPKVLDGDCAGADWGPLDHDGATIEVKYPGYGQGTPGIGGASSLTYTTSESKIYEATHIPPNTTLLFIERIDNSN